MGTRVYCIIGLLIVLATNLSSQTSTIGRVATKPQALTTYKPSVNVLKSADRKIALQNQVPNVFDQGFSGGQGTFGANYNLKTGEIWAVSINDGIGAEDYGSAGFQTNGIQNTGSSPWRGVTVTAVVEVITISGSPVHFCVGYPNSGGWGPSCMSIGSPGRYQLTTGAFDMPPNSIFQGSAHIYGMPSQNTPSGVYARFISIKMNL